MRGGTGERAELQPLLMSTTGTLSPGAFRAVIDLAAPADGGRVQRFPCLALVYARSARIGTRNDPRDAAGAESSEQGTVYGTGFLRRLLRDSWDGPPEGFAACRRYRHSASLPASTHVPSA